MYKQILLAVDLNDENSWKRALPVAVSCARAFEATLHLVTVVPDFGMSTVAQFFPADFEKKAVEQTRKELHAFVENHLDPDLRAELHVRSGTIYEEILAAVKKHKADLAVLAANRPELKDYLLGPNAARVVRHAECSVLVVRD